MAYIDPWGPTLEAMSGVGTALQNYGQMSRQAELDRMAREDWEFKKAERERTLADALAEREALAKASKPYDVTTPNPEYEKYQQTLGQAMGPPVPKEDIARYENMGPYEKLNYGPAGALDAQIAGWKESNQSLEAANRALPEQAPEPTLTTKVTPHPLKAQVEAGRALAAQGNPLGIAMMSAAQKSLHDEMTNVIAMGDYGAAAKIYSDVSGVPVTPYDKDRYKIGDHHIVDFKGLQKDLDTGMPYQAAAVKNMVQLTPTDAADKTAEAVFIHNRTQQLIADGKMTPMDAKVKAAQEFIASQLKNKQALESTRQLNRIELVDRRAGHAANLKRTIPGMSESDYDTLATMATEGRLPPNINSRSAAVLAQIDKRTGGAVDFNQLKADSAAQTKVRQIGVVMEANEKDATLNFNRLETLLPKLGNGSIPILNSVINRIEQGLGAPEPGTAEAVAYEAMTRYAKVITGQTTGQAVTDTAAKGAKDLLSVLRDNPKQASAKIAQFRGMMTDNRRAYDETYESLTGRSVNKDRAKGQNKGQLDAATAKSYLQKAGGDKAKARELAKADGWSF